MLPRTALCRCSPSTLSNTSTQSATTAFILLSLPNVIRVLSSVWKFTRGSKQTCIEAAEKEQNLGVKRAKNVNRKCKDQTCAMQVFRKNRFSIRLLMRLLPQRVPASEMHSFQLPAFLPSQMQPHLDRWRPGSFRRPHTSALKLIAMASHQAGTT